MKKGERCAYERRKTGKMEHFGLNMINGKQGLSGALGPHCYCVFTTVRLTITDVFL
jgi:hypothetical protein